MLTPKQKKYLNVKNMEKIKGYKVTDKDMKCRGFQYEIGKTYQHTGSVALCDSGFHFCRQANDCFKYCDFDTDNRVFEIEASGKIDEGEDKCACSEITLIRELSWEEVLRLVNTGKGNTGRMNSGDRNSGYSNSGNRNSGDWNSGDWNSGDWNSGYSNSGNSNSGNSNSGNWNSGNWNSGDSNSGYSNSGYRNSGAFCADENPKIFLFDQPTNMTVKEWERSKAVAIMQQYLIPNIWVEESLMSEQEKKDNPSHKTTGGYLKKISMHEAWANMWNDLSDEYKKVFTTLPNFDAAIFEKITGIKVTAP